MELHGGVAGQPVPLAAIASTVSARHAGPVYAPDGFSPAPEALHDQLRLSSLPISVFCLGDDWYASFV